MNGMSEEQKIRPSFWSFNIGHVLTLVTFLVASIAAYYGIKTDVTVIDVRVTAIDTRAQRVETAITALTAGVIDNARQDERIRFIERRLDRLEESPRK